MNKNVRQDGILQKCNNFFGKLFKSPNVTNMNDKCTRTRETKQVLAIGTNMDKLTFNMPNSILFAKNFSNHPR